LENFGGELAFAESDRCTALAVLVDRRGNDDAYLLAPVMIEE
jgi:hypothetical protein